MAKTILIGATIKYVDMWAILFTDLLEIYLHETSSYMARFVDRDMIMHFWGGGVGHKSTRTATDTFTTEFARVIQQPS